MKILGFTYYHDAHQLVMKCDSSLLNNHKPFFVPEWCEDMRVSECTAVRVSRLGKHIAPRFASRYYDALAAGLDFYAEDWMKKNIAQATAFDYALAVGAWMNTSEFPEEWLPATLSIDNAIAKVSEVVTIRQGDIIFVDLEKEAQKVERDQIIERIWRNNTHLYCKIK